jgi:hypothetical protein
VLQLEQHFYREYGLPSTHAMASSCMLPLLAYFLQPQLSPQGREFASYYAIIMNALVCLSRFCESPQCAALCIAR